MSAREVNQGLPEALPRGERILWRGRPDPVALAFAAHRLGWVIAWFVAILAFRLVAGIHDGVPAGILAADALWIVVVGAAAVGLVLGLAVLAARSTAYTVTDRRIVMKIGVALPMTINLPFAVIEAAAVKTRRGGVGDLAFRLVPGSRVGWMVLWPHARAFHFARPEPALRAIPDVEGVARRVAEALAAAVEAAPAAAPAATAPRVVRRAPDPVGLPTAAE